MNENERRNHMQDALQASMIALEEATNRMARGLDAQRELAISINRLLSVVAALVVEPVQIQLDTVDAEAYLWDGPYPNDPDDEDCRER